MMSLFGDTIRSQTETPQAAKRSKTFAAIWANANAANCDEAHQHRYGEGVRNHADVVGEARAR